MFPLFCVTFGAFDGLDLDMCTIEIYCHSHDNLIGIGTPFWKLVLKQFDDLLVKILIVSAIVSFLLALINGETGLSAFLEPSVRKSFLICCYIHYPSLSLTFKLLYLLLVIFCKQFRFYWKLYEYLMLLGPKLLFSTC